MDSVIIGNIDQMATMVKINASIVIPPPPRPCGPLLYIVPFSMAFFNAFTKEKQFLPLMYAIVYNIVLIDAPFYTHINFCVWLVKRSTLGDFYIQGKPCNNKTCVFHNYQSLTSIKASTLFLHDSFA